MKPKKPLAKQEHWYAVPHKLILKVLKWNVKEVREAVARKRITPKEDRVEINNILRELIGYQGVIVGKVRHTSTGASLDVGGVTLRFSNTQKGISIKGILSSRTGMTPSQAAETVRNNLLEL